MSKELEDRISEWVDGQVDGVTPVTMEEVVDGRSSARSRSDVGANRRRWSVPAVAAAAALVIGAAGLVVLGGDDAPEQVVVGGPADDEETGTDRPDAGDDGTVAEEGWITFTEPSFGWTWEQPATWTTQSERDYCGGEELGMSLTMITNTGQRLSHPIVDSGCNSTWALPQPLPNGFLGVSVSALGSTLEVLGDFPAEPTEFPLDAGELKPYEGAPIGVLPDRMLVINHEGRRYGVSTFEGPGVTDEDQAALARMIASIEPTDLPPADPIAFTWLPPGATVVAGPPPPVSPTARLEFTDGEGNLDESRSVRVDAQTIRGALLFTRADMAAASPEIEPELLPGVTPIRERIQLRGVEVVHDRAVDGDTRASRFIFFDYDILAVEVLAQNVPDDELYRIIEGLRFVAVGGPAG